MPDTPANPNSSACACLQAVPGALLADGGGGGGGGSSGSLLGRRLLRKCPLFPLLIENDCQEFPIQVAVVTQLPRDVDSSYCNNTATRAGEWCTRLGIDLDVNATAEAFPALNNSIYYFLCA